MTHDPTPPEGYRPLREGEVIRKGDIIQFPDGKFWRVGTDWPPDPRTHWTAFRPLRPNPADDAE